MADDPIKQIQNAIKQLDKVVDNSLSAKNMKLLAKEAANNMKERIRRGKGVDTHEGSELALKPLTKRTIEIRRNLLVKGQLRNETSPSKSNVTRSGQVTDSIQGTAFKRARGRIFLNDIRFDSDKSNSQVAGELEQGGRKFFNLSRNEVKSIAKGYGLLFAREFSKLLTKK